ncbi:AhpD-like protein [Halenospora varia]|nr:AhpD-like protein [Halenospora varia]
MKGSDDTLLGPFGPLLHTPTMVKPWIEINHEVSKLLSARDRELAILAVLAYAPADYGLYAHRKISRAVGFTDEQIKDAEEGRTPKGLSEKEMVTYDFAQELVRLKDPMAKGCFEKVESIIGKEGVAAVIHTTGLFLYSSMILNSEAVQVPEEESS